MNDLIDRVASLFGLTRADLVSSSRRRHISEARQAAAWALRATYPQLSLESIGSLLGRRDHTTISHAIAQTEERMRLDAEYAARLRSLLPAHPAIVAGVERAMRRQSVLRGAAWWVRQSVPWQPLAA